MASIRCSLVQSGGGVGHVSTSGRGSAVLAGLLSSQRAQFSTNRVMLAMGKAEDCVMQTRRGRAAAVVALASGQATAPQPYERLPADTSPTVFEDGAPELPRVCMGADDGRGWARRMITTPPKQTYSIIATLARGNPKRRSCFHIFMIYVSWSVDEAATEGRLCRGMHMHAHCSASVGGCGTVPYTFITTVNLFDGTHEACCDSSRISVV